MNNLDASGERGSPRRAPDRGPARRRGAAGTGAVVALVVGGLVLLVAVLTAPYFLMGGDEPEAAGAAQEQPADGADGDAAAGEEAAPAQEADDAPEPVPEGDAVLPDDIEWETNYDDPPIGSPEAVRGGRVNLAITQYPMTFRLMGPNSNDAFAGWNRSFTMDFALVSRHPVTDNYIPWMATHWSVQDDERTIYFRLDPDAEFSDGTPITADDFVFTWEMMQSEHIVDPFYNNFADEYYESVDRIDDHTLRIVGTRPSWRPLSDYGGLWPTPAHATELDEDWVERTNNEWQIAPGPYVVSDVSRGESVTLERVDDWWGEGKHYFEGMYNVDRIHLRVVPPDRMLDHLRRGEIDAMVETTARSWNEDYTFDAIENGWVRRAQVFTQNPTGIYGLHMNLEAPIFQDRDFRVAMHHLFNFERLNRNLMFDEYFRQLSFFEGTEYANPDVVPREFDPRKAREHLERAGYQRPDEIRGGNLLENVRNAVRGLLFTRSDTDDILVNEDGEKASFTVIYGSPGLTRHLTVMQQEYRRAGIDMQLRLLEPGTAFERGLERKYEMIVTARTAGFYPSPNQYLHTTFRDAINNNNIWGFGTEEVDELIRVYEEDLDFDARLEAMHRIDEIVHEEAFYIPFWHGPFMWIVHWDHLRFPEFYVPMRTQQLTDWMVYWVDPEREERLDDAMRTGEALPVDDDIDVDHWGVREGLEP